MIIHTVKSSAKHGIKLQCIFIPTHTWYVNGFLWNKRIGWL